MEYHLQLELWRGNVAGAYQIARQRGELSDWLVSMAPLASYEFYEQVCGEYAEQLEEEGQYHKAVTYLLAAQRVHVAIDLFRRHRLFKEAVSLAKVRLPALDPILEDLYTEWGQSLMKDGRFEQAAKCYLAMRQVQEAGKLLSRRSDQASLKVACQMSLLAGERQPDGMTYAFRLFTQYLVAGEWTEAHAVIAQHKTLEVLLPLVCTHKLLVQQLVQMYPDLSLTQEPLNPENNSLKENKVSAKGLNDPPVFLLDKSETDPVVPWAPHLIGAHSFPHYVLRAWCQDLALSLALPDLQYTIEALTQMTLVSQTSSTSSQVLVQASLGLTLTMLCLLTSETTSATLHLLHCLSALHQGGHSRLLQGLCRLVLPQGPKYLLKLQQEFTASRVLITMETSSDKFQGGVHSSIKRYLTDLKDDAHISMPHPRCRELDCVRAYFYMVVLDYLGDPANVRAGLVGAKTSEKDIGISSVLDKSGVKDATVGELSKLTSGSVNPYKQNGAASPSASPSVSPSALSSNSLLSQSLPNPSSSVDPPPVPSSQSKPSASATPVKPTTSPVKPTTSPRPDTVISRVTNDSVSSHIKNGDIAHKTGSNSSHITNRKVSSHAGKSDTLLDPPSPSSKDSGHLSLTNGQLSLKNLLRLSKGILWDVQAKRDALTETLGYIHRAISQHLLTNRSVSDDASTSSSLGSSSLTSSGEPHDINGAAGSRGVSVSPTPPPLLSGTPDILKGAHTPSDPAPPPIRLEVSFKGPARSLSEPAPRTDPLSSPLENNMATSSLEFQVEKELLGSITGYMSHSQIKSKQILWEDNTCGGGGEPTPVSSSLSSLPGRDGVPPEWDELPVDVKFSQPYVSLSLLRQEQEALSQELKRAPDTSKVPFPPCQSSVRKLVSACLASPLLTAQDKATYHRQLGDWATLFSVTSQQKLDTETFFTETGAKLGV